MIAGRYGVKLHPFILIPEGAKRPMLLTTGPYNVQNCRW